MTITELLTDTAVLAGMLLMTALAVVPAWLRLEAEREERGPAGPEVPAAGPARRPTVRRPLDPRVAA